MKKLIGTTILGILICLFSNAQSSGGDGGELDSSWRNPAHRPYLQSVLQAPVLIGSSAEETINPTSQKICFDKIIKVKSSTGSTVLESCVFLNTKIGLIGYFNVKPGGPGICDLKPEDPDFHLNIVGLKGNLYNYYNVRKNGNIQHWVSTGNTNRYQYQYAQSGTSAVMHKKTERRDYCGGKIKAWSYKYEGRPDEWFLFGKNFPEEIRMEPRKYLGTFGIGFQNTDKGLFIIMELLSTSLDAKITDIRDVDVCFDPAPFKIFEDEFANKQLARINRDRERLTRDEARAAGKPCAESEIVRISYQKTMLDELEDNIQVTGRQNIYHEDPSTQKKRTELMINYNSMIQVAIYETKHKICLTEKEIIQAKGDAGSYQRKLDCLHLQLDGQMRIQREMEVIDRQHARDPNMAFEKKARLFLEVLSGCGL